jgi:hypothetical protein
MNTHHGLAWAIKPKKSNHALQACRVQGVEKDNITLEETWEVPLSITNRQSVKRAFEKLFHFTGEVIDEHVSSKNPSSLPMISGWAVEFGEGDGLTILTEKLKSIFGKRFKKQNVKSKEGQQKFMRDTMDSVVRERKLSNEVELWVHTRGFIFDGDVAEAIKNESHEQEEKLEEIYQKISNGDRRAVRSLLHLAEEYAIGFARHLAMQSPDIRSARFWSTGPSIEALKDKNRLNFTAWNEKVRQHYGRKIIQLCAIDHNIAVKTPQDTPGPAFVDPLTTMVADNIDRQNFGTVKPSVVLAKYKGTPEESRKLVFPS